MNNFNLIQEHFTQLHCPNCDLYFTKDSVNLIREEKDYWVVKVCCSNCNHSPGFAIVGIEYENQLGDPVAELEKLKFKNQPPITTDDVLNAHEFIQNLGSDWMKYLNKSSSS